MKKLLVQVHSKQLANNKLFGREGINDTSYYWGDCKKTLEKRGYNLMTADENNLNDCAGIIFCEAASIDNTEDIKTQLKNILKKILGIKIFPKYPTRNLYKEGFEAGLLDTMILCIHEPRSVESSNFNPSVWSKFKHILTWDDTLTQDPLFTKYCPPVTDYGVLREPLPFNQKKLLVNMSANKYSSYKNELYSERRKSITYFDSRYPNDFDLYGARWNMPVTRLDILFPFLVKNYKTHRGYVENKIETLSKYKFNLCYENISDSYGYVTEKIFDSLKARVVPIYWGAPNIDAYVDSDTFIDRRKFKNNEELAQFITKMTEQEYTTYIEAGARYLQSEKFSKFLSKDFCNIIIKMLALQ